MYPGNPRFWKAIGGCALAAAGAALVLCIRLTIAPISSGNTPPSTESIHRISPAEKTDIGNLLASTTDGKPDRWMEENPAAMMAFIDALEDRSQAAELATRFVQAVRNPHHDLLLDWLTRQQDSRVAAVVFRGILPRLSRENPEQSIILSLSLGDSPDAMSAREELFAALPLEQRWLLMERQSATERASLLARRAAGFGSRAPERCLEVIAALPPSPHRTEAAAGLMKSWANGADTFRLADSMSAVKHAAEIHEQELRRECLALAVREWSDKNPHLASRWITGLPVGPDRDAAIGGLVQRLAAADPASAAEWAAAISDETLRHETLGRLATTPSGNAPDKP